MGNISTRSRWRWMCAHFIAFCFLALTTSLHASQQKIDVTGFYGVSGNCTDKSMEEFGGDAGTKTYFENCFNGQNKFTKAEYLVLVQNGNDVCGYFSSIHRKIYEGRMIGHAQGNIVTLHHETGHHNSGPAPVSKFMVSGSELKPIQDSFIATQYIRRAKKLQRSSFMASCKPEPGRDYMLLDPGMLKNAANMPNLLNFNFSDFKAEKPKKRPNPQTITILDKSRNFEFKDTRQESNYMARNMTVFNNSKIVWEVCAVHSMACREQYRFNKSDGGIGSRTFEDSQGFVLSRNQSVKLLSCKDSVWSFQNKTLCDADKNAKGCEC